MAHTRTAIDTIRGYYYQFDLYALQILESKGENITLEGIEDVDVNSATETTAIQCKYYEGTTYNHSVIAEPIRWMLKHFKNHKTDTFKYKLYGFYKDGQDKLMLPLTVEFVKDKFLTFKEKGTEHKLYSELELSDADISLFVSRLEVDINAMSFVKQNELLLKMIRQCWNCSQIEAENFYYPLILKLVREIATDKIEENRTIDKNTFIEKIIAHKNPLVDIWFAKKCVSNEYCKSMHKMYFCNRMNMNPYERFFLIDCDNSIADVEIKQMVITICNKWSKFSIRDTNPFVPYFYLNGLSNDRLLKIKELLYSDGMLVNDGYPFRLSSFKPRVMSQKPVSGQCTIKIIDKIEFINDVLHSIQDKIREIYQFYLDKPFFDIKEEHKLISIYIESTKDVEQII